MWARLLLAIGPRRLAKGLAGGLVLVAVAGVLAVTLLLGAVAGSSASSQDPAPAACTMRAESGSAVCTIEVENCQLAFETLKSRGVTFESPETLEFPWGYAARFQDPDGNLLQVREGRGAFRR